MVVTPGRKQQGAEGEEDKDALIWTSVSEGGLHPQVTQCVCFVYSSSSFE